MKRLRLVMLVGYLLLIVALSTRPGLHAPGPGFHYKDKIIHFAEYSVLGWLLFANFGARVSRSRLATFMFLVAIGATIGALDEMLQGMVPERDMDVYDWVADVAGVAVMTGFLLLRKGKPSGITAPSGGESR